MFAEELVKIKESEEKADELLRKAKAEARQALENANAKAEEMIEAAGATAREIADSLLKEGKEISDEQYHSFLAEAREDCRAMTERAGKNEEAAVDLIAERIVSRSVNR